MSAMRWRYRDPRLLWLLPAAYGCHLGEEYFGGFTAWIAGIVGRPLPDGAFLAINAVALALMIGAIRLAADREDYGWMAIAVATVLFVNAGSHLLGSLATGSYSPGLITGIVLYVPIAGLVLLRAWDQAARDQVNRGLVVGLVAHAIVFVLAASIARGSANPR